MAYDKHTWTCDEPITVERLNHIEDGIANAGGDCDCGYECTETKEVLTEESVTTVVEEGAQYAVGELTYLPESDLPETLEITFNGTTYICRYTDDAYGAPYNDSINSFDWSEYPFNINYRGSFYLVTETAGTYSIKLASITRVVTTSPCFDEARGYSCEDEWVYVTEESVTTSVDSSAPITAPPVGLLQYTEALRFSTIKVVFEGNVYICPNQTPGLTNSIYGATVNGTTVDWSEYPFVIRSSPKFGGSGYDNRIITQNSGTYSVSIQAAELVATVTDCFRAAVEKVVHEKTVESISADIPANSFLKVEQLVATNSSQVSIPANSEVDVSLSGASSTGASASDFYCVNYIKIEGHDVIALRDFSAYKGNGNNIDVNVGLCNTSNEAVTLASSSIRARVLHFYTGTNQTTSFCAVKGTCPSIAPPIVE